VNSWTPTLVSAILPATSRLLAIGQTGYLFGGLQSGFFVATSTGWHSIFNNRIYFGSNRNRYCINLKNLLVKVIWLFLDGVAGL
jgi:hypothetical protein